MSQTHLASVPDPSIANRSADWQEPKLWQQPIRSPDIQAEVERIGTIDPYVAVGRASASIRLQIAVKVAASASSIIAIAK